MNRERPHRRLAPALGGLILTLLALGLRLHRLDLQPLWGDEGWSFYFAWLSPGQMLRLTAEDIHPPLYYALLGPWLRLLGSTPAIARLLSVFFGVLLVPLAYRVGRRLFDPAAGLAAAAVIALSPFAIYYSQEVRMYGLVTLLGLASVYFFIQQAAAGEHPGGVPPQADRRRRPDWSMLGYILVTTGALYTMYYALFIPAFQLITFLAGQPRRRLSQLAAHPFVRSLAVVALLYLPWVVYAGARLAAYVQGKRTAEGYLPLGLWRFLQSHLTAFSLGHLSETTHILAWVTLLFLPVALLGLFYRPSRPGSVAVPVRSPALLLGSYLVLPLLLGYLVNLVYPFTPRFFERTLMLAAPAWWLLLGAGLAWLWQRSRPAMVGVSALLLLTQGVMWLDFYNVPRYGDEDNQALMAQVRRRASPEDAFLASYQWQVGYYYAYLPEPRPRLVQVPGWGESWAADPARMRADLDRLLEEHPRLWFPAYQALGRMWESQAEAYLKQSAYPALVDWSLPSTKLLLFARGEDLQPAAAPFNFANRLRLEQAELGSVPVEAGRGVLPIRLTWRKLDSLGSDHRVALRLTEPAGRTWASQDSLPQGGLASFTALAPGEALVDQHGLLIPAGLPPGQYQLHLSVVNQADERALDLLDAQAQPQGVEALLGTLQVVPPQAPLPPDALPVQYPHAADFDGQVRLLGYSIGQGPFRAGEPLAFSLFWQSLADGNEAYQVFAQLQDQTGQPLALSETPLAYPSDRWRAGTLLRDPREIPLPATLPAGTYRLAVGLLRPDRSRLPAGGADQVVLAEVEIAQRPHHYAPPSPAHPLEARFGQPARLVGYDLRGASPAREGQTLTLVLHWQALETFDRPYKVFVHLVDADGHILAQHDQVPGGGDYPTTSWVPGEYLADAYPIPIPPGTPPDQYWLEVGFYDPVDGARLGVTDAAGQPLGDRLLLEQTPVRLE